MCKGEGLVIVKELSKDNVTVSCQLVLRPTEGTYEKSASLDGDAILEARAINSRKLFICGRYLPKLDRTSSHSVFGFCVKL